MGARESGSSREQGRCFQDAEAQALKEELTESKM